MVSLGFSRSLSVGVWVFGAALVLSMPMFTATQVHAGPPGCSCEHLDSLQQDLKNAIFLEGYMRGLAAHLAAYEQRMANIKKNDPTNPDANIYIRGTTSNMREAYASTHLKLPFPRIKGYTGPDSVNMIYGTCEQPKAALDGLEAGSPCEAMADAALAHELAHRDLCKKMGPEAYWDRPHSEIALEEAAAYKAQAANLRSELRRVLEGAQVEYRGQYAPTIAIPSMMSTSYLYRVQTGDIGGATGTDRWTMTGQGTITTTITKASIGGMSCRPGGAITGNIAVSLTTDGLEFGLAVQGRNQGDQVSLACPGGGGMSMPATDPLSGTIVTSQVLSAGENRLQGDWGAPMRPIVASFGGTVTGDTDMALFVTCKAQ